jgi:hypothetical protein
MPTGMPLDEHPLLASDPEQGLLLALDLHGVLRVRQQPGRVARDVADVLQRSEGDHGEREHHQDPEGRQTQVQAEAVEPPTPS